MPLLRQPLLVLLFLALAGLLHFGSAVAGFTLSQSDASFAEAANSPSPHDPSRPHAAATDSQHEARLAVDRAPLPAADRLDSRSSHGGEWRYREGRRMSGQRSVGLAMLWCGEGLDAAAVAVPLRGGRAFGGPPLSLPGSLVTQHIRLQL